MATHAITTTFRLCSLAARVREPRFRGRWRYSLLAVPVPDVRARAGVVATILLRPLRTGNGKGSRLKK